MPASNAKPRADNIAIRLVTVDRMSVRPPVASVYTRGTPRESDLGNLDRRNCVLCSLSACQFLSWRNGEIVGASLDRFCPPAMWNNDDDGGDGKFKTRENFRGTQLTNQLSLYNPRRRKTSTESRFRNDLYSGTTTRRYGVDKPCIN